MRQNNFFFPKKKRKNIYYNIHCYRSLASIDSEPKLGEQFFLRHFKAGFQRIFEPFLVFHILKGFKALQSSSNCFKSSEKQIGFSHGNLFTCFQTLRPRIRGFLLETGFSLLHYIDTTLMVEILPNRSASTSIT